MASSKRRTAGLQTLLLLCAAVPDTTGSSFCQSVILLQFNYSEHWPATRTLFEDGYVSALGLPTTNPDLNFTVESRALPITTDSAANQLRRALAYGKALVNTSYGWWTGGQIPVIAPAWAEQDPAPTVQAMRDASIFCAALPNLMLRLLGQAVPCEFSSYCGGTAAYACNFSSVATPFNITVIYPAGASLHRSGLHPTTPAHELYTR